MRIIIISLILFLILFMGCEAGVSSSDTKIILEFYQGLTNTRALNWDVSANPCTFTGITCNSDSPQRIISIVFSNLYVAGPVPVNLGQLTELQTLSLDGNFLEGTIPNTLGDLSNLKTLNLKGNLLFGTLSAEFSKLSQLTYLDVSNNQLSGPIPSLASNTMLTWLYLARNAFCPIANYSAWATSTDYIIASGVECGACTASYICMNGGTCSPSNNEQAGELMYKCNCATGYEGTNCENWVDTCLSSPCLNGGNCSMLFNNFTCECPAGFSGATCQINLNLAPLINLTKSGAGIMLLACSFVFIIVAIGLKYKLLPPPAPAPRIVSLFVENKKAAPEQRGMFEWR